MVDFTLAIYRRLLKELLDEGYAAVRVADYLVGERPPQPKRLLILRHDVEWNSGRALAMARVEHAFNVRSTYYFRADTRAYNLRVMGALREMGHEIGYHFNVLDRCKGDFAAATRLFSAELARFRSDGFPVRTVCSHGDPRVPKIGYRVNYDLFHLNPDLLVRCELLGEAYLSIDFSSLVYVSDAGVRWNRGLTTPGLLRLLREEAPQVVYLLAHPDYWSSNALRAISLRNLAKIVRASRVNRAIAGVRLLARAVRRSSRSSTGGRS